MGGVVVLSADIIVATSAMLAVCGGGFKWVIGRMDKQAATFEAKLAKMEGRYARLRTAFQMVSTELARKDPNNPALHQAQMVLIAGDTDVLTD